MPRTAKGPTLHQRAVTVAEACEDAYSVDRYTSWPAVARALLMLGMTEREAEAVMRSKITRRAADRSEAPYGQASGLDVARYLDMPAERLATEVRELVQETFSGLDNGTGHDKGLVTDTDYADMVRRFGRKG